MSTGSLNGLGMLKRLPCPAGDNCKAFRCLFRHKGDEEKWPLAEQKAEAKPTDDAGEANTSKQDQLGKRHRSGADEYDPTSPALDISSVPNQQIASEPVTAPSEPLQASQPQTATSGRSISPPPLKRAKIEATTATDSAFPPATPQGKQTTLTLQPTKALTPAQAKPKRKPEELNPRHLKSAPATHEIRYKLVTMLHAEYARLNKELTKDPADKALVLSDQELIWMTLDDEETTARERPAIYSNVLKNKIVAHKRMTKETWRKERQEEVKKGQHKSPHKLSDKPVSLESGLTREQELVILSTQLLTPVTELSRHGYVPTVPTEEDINKAKEAEQMSKGWEPCDRCSTRFQVFPGRREEDGALTSGGTCTHHPGRPYFPPRQPGSSSSNNTKKYRCCNEAVGDSPGCTKGDTHVWRTSDPKRLAGLWNFVETPPNPLAPTDRAVCFDCEMGYTAKGLEMIRLTATSWPDGAELLDVLVQPYGEILDLNSRYSGVYREDIANALAFSTTTKPPPPKEGERKRLQMVSSPEVARDLLFSLIGPETPLIGHALDNDLNSARIVHPTIVDTVLLFPHNKGLPIRNGLKALVEMNLRRTIQADTPGQLAGHDSAEDARAAGDLVRFRLKHVWNKLEMQGWKFEGTTLVAPPK